MSFCCVCCIVDLYYYFFNFIDKEIKRKMGGYRDVEEVWE